MTSIDRRRRHAIQDAIVVPDDDHDHNPRATLWLLIHSPNGKNIALPNEP